MKTIFKNDQNISSCCLTHFTRKTAQMISDENIRQQTANNFTNISACFCNKCGKDCEITNFNLELTEKLADVLLGEKIPLDIILVDTGEVIIPANRKIVKKYLRKMAKNYQNIEIDPSPVRNKIRQIIGEVCAKHGKSF